MESVNWTAKVHQSKHKGKGKDDIDSIMDDYDEIMTDMAGRKRGGAGMQQNPMFWPEDKMMFMKELSRYRNLYVEMAKLLKETKKAFKKRAKEFAKKEKVFQKQAKDFMHKENQFVEKDQIIVHKEKLFAEELTAREHACKEETDAVRMHMEQLLEAKANNFTKAMEVQQQEHAQREKNAKRKLDSKLEAKEQHFAKVVDGLQGSFESLKRSVAEAQERCAVVTRERDESRAECKRFQSEMYIAMDERVQAEARIEELAAQGANLEAEKQRLLTEAADVKSRLYVSGAEIKKQSAQNTWNTARIQELEEAVEDIWDAQNLRATLDHDSISQYYDDLQTTSKDLHTTQSQLADLTMHLSERENDVGRQREVMELQQKELLTSKSTIATLNDLIRRLSTRAAGVRRPVAQV